MSYTKTVWEDLPSTDTPLNATNLNNIEDGIEDIDQEVEGVSQSLGVETNTYDNTATYSVGDKVIYENKIYECNTDISTAEDFDSSKWDLVPVIDNMKINNKLIEVVDTGWIDMSAYVNTTYFSVRSGFAPHVRIRNGVVYWKGEVLCTTAVGSTGAYLLVNIPDDYIPSSLTSGANQITGAGNLVASFKDYIIYINGAAKRIQIAMSSNITTTSSWEGFSLSNIPPYPID